MKFGKKYKNYLYYHFPWQMLLVIIFILSSISQQNLPDFTREVSDKILHFIVFGLLGFFMIHSFKNSYSQVIQKYAAGWAIIFTSGYGIVDELHQILVPGRSCSLGDWLADTAGALLAVTLFLVFRNYKNKHRVTDQAA